LIADDRIIVSLHSTKNWDDHQGEGVIITIKGIT